MQLIEVRRLQAGRKYAKSVTEKGADPAYILHLPDLRAVLGDGPQTRHIEPEDQTSLVADRRI
jgi:hypothetical protein